MATTSTPKPEETEAPKEKTLGEYTMEEINAADTSLVDGDQWNKRDAAK